MDSSAGVGMTTRKLVDSWGGRRWVLWITSCKLVGAGGEYAHKLHPDWHRDAGAGGRKRGMTEWRGGHAHKLHPD